MSFLLLSFIAGILTVLAPCVLPLLPVIIGGSIANHEKRNPVLITGSLAVSVVLFTLLLKVSTVFINIPESTWSIISGGVIFFFGIITAFPTVWERVSIRLNLTGRSTAIMEQSVQKQTRWSDILLGASLGPVFSSCSPTYFVILADVLPKSLATGLVDLIVYAIGLSLTLLLIAHYGQKLVKKVSFAADPHGWFKRSLGILFIAVGLLIMSGYDRSFQTFVSNHEPFDITKVEQSLLGHIQ